ncbi:hypothetical protein ABIB85_004688 [Bradyrhizobium sp. JR1.5]
MPWLTIHPFRSRYRIALTLQIAVSALPCKSNHTGRIREDGGRRFPLDSAPNQQHPKHIVTEVIAYAAI